MGSFEVSHVSLVTSCPPLFAEALDTQLGSQNNTDCLTYVLLGYDIKVCC